MRFRLPPTAVTGSGEKWGRALLKGAPGAMTGPKWDRGFRPVSLSRVVPLPQGWPRALRPSPSLWEPCLSSQGPVLSTPTPRFGLALLPAAAPDGSGGVGGTPLSLGPRGSPSPHACPRASSCLAGWGVAGKVTGIPVPGTQARRLLCPDLRVDSQIGLP
uniref:Uncharacterized protein n=1 Tax=Mustela putorius furo TaxID=9669 RepID=M3YLT9_MUSPF